MEHQQQKQKQSQFVLNITKKSPNQNLIVMQQNKTITPFWWSVTEHNVHYLTMTIINYKLNMKMCVDNGNI